MAETFLHGVEVLDIDSGPRPVQTVATSVIGLIGTAPDADPVAFPLNTPVLIAGSRREAAKLDMTGDGLGTLPSAMDSIFDQAGAVVIVVRVNKETTDAATLANILGGVNALTDQYEGVYAFLGAKSDLGVAPRILIAPGFTHQRVTNGVLTIAKNNVGAGYTNGEHALVFTGGGGSGAAGKAVVAAGVVASVTLSNSGSGYTTAPTAALAGTAGAGTTPATFTLTRGTAGNATVAELIGIAERLRAVIIADGPNTTDADAQQYAGDFGSKRVYLVDPQALKTSAVDGSIYADYSSPMVAGLLAKSDNERGFWWSPSNQNINGIVGTARSVDFSMGDPSSRANLLNAGGIATIIREDGYRLWGNQTLASDAKWKYLCVVRTNDIIADSLQAAHLWAVDRGIDKQYFTNVVDSVQAYLDHLKLIGAILGGVCWADPDLNTPDQIALGHVYFDYDFSPSYPSEHITMRSHLVGDYLKEIF